MVFESGNKLRVLLFCAGLFSLLNISVTAQTRDAAKEKEYESQLAVIQPSLVPLFHSATLAMDKGDWKLADSLYSIVYKEAPGFDHAVRRLGSVKQSLGLNSWAITLAEKAVELNRSSANIITLAELLIFSNEQDQAKASEMLGRALNLLQEGINKEGADDFEYTYLMAEARLRMNHKEDFNALTNHLLSKHSDKMVTHYLAAIMAANDEEWTKAEDEILKAKAMGLPAEDVNAFLDSGIHTSALTERSKKVFLWVLLIWALGFVVLYLVGLLLSNYTLSAIEKQFKAEKTTGLAHTLRKIYRYLINSAGLYYYFSLPIVLILVVVLVCGLFYFFFSVGHLPIKLMLVIGIGGIVSIYAMIRSILVKVNYEDPGRELKETEAPGLFALTKEVAATMGTRPVDEIRITPETDLAVYEKGSWREKLRDKGKRILILGTGVLKDFKEGDFKAVLAHEYGHFSHRDTAGGAVALRVRNDMHKYYVALYNQGQAVWWNMAFLFLRLYDFIFHRISNGSTRLQEVLADRVAAQTYGAVAFENGLTYVIRRNIEFVKLARLEIEAARLVKRPFNNLYELTTTATADIEEEVKKSLSRETTNDDTHPSPTDRFRFIEGIGLDKTPDNNRRVADLFSDWTGLTTEMTNNIEASWKNA